MKELKKGLFLALLTIGVAMASCGDGDDGASKAIELTGGTSTTQTVFANETTANEGIKFTATEAWTATVSEVTITRAAAGRVDWMELSAYSGGAGEFTLTMTLQPNLTGKSRKAEIRITCGDTTIVIVVEQKGTMQDGTVRKMVSKVIYEYTDNADDYKSSDSYKSYEFKYDTSGRIAECIKKNGPDASEANLKYTETTTFDYTIVNEIRLQRRRVYHDTPSGSADEPEKSTVTLNKSGFATRITYSPDYVNFEYNADNRLSKIDGMENDYSKYWTTLGYTDGMITKTVSQAAGDSDEYSEEHTVDELYPHRYANDKLNVDPNGFLYNMDDKSQLLYTVRLLGNGSKCCMERKYDEEDEATRAIEGYPTPNVTVHETYTYTEYTATSNPIIYQFDKDGYNTALSWNVPFKKMRVDYDVVVGNTPVYPEHLEGGYKYTITNRKTTEIGTDRNIHQYSFTYAD